MGHRNLHPSWLSLYPHINRVFFFTRWKKKLTNTTSGCHVEKIREPQLPFPSKGWASSEQAFRVSAQKAMNTLSTWFWGATMFTRSRHLARIIGLPVLRSILKQTEDKPCGALPKGRWRGTRQIFLLRPFLTFYVCKAHPAFSLVIYFYLISQFSLVIHIKQPIFTIRT